MTDRLKAAVLGASGYTGAETIRLIANHPHLTLSVATGNAQAGRSLREIFPHLAQLSSLVVVRAEDVDWSDIDVVFSCLPHGTSQDVIETLPEHLKIIDLSADYRLRDASLYREVYGREHLNPALTRTTVYGLTELARDKLNGERLVACPGCYPTATLLALLPLAHSGVIATDPIIIDAKSGVSGAGRGLKEGNLFSEAAEGLHPYGVGVHRHAPEIDQELQAAFKENDVRVTFTPHLVPMTRGELVTCYVRGQAEDCHRELNEAYTDAAFVDVLPMGSPPPDTRHVRGTNNCRIAVFPDRVSGRSIIVAAIDNLIKGSSGQAIQNLNLMMGWDETTGLSQLTPLFP